MKGPVQSVEVSYLVHMTEDKERLVKAVGRTLGLEAPGAEESLEGHHGNVIVRVEYHVTSDAASALFDRLVSALPAEAKREVASDLGTLMDEHSALYLRLDKQALVVGRLALGGEESVRVRVKPRLFALKGSALEFYRAAFGEGA